MLVLHAHWSLPSAELQLWAEDPAGPPTTRRGQDAVPLHPFAADFDDLEQALGPLLPGDAPELDGDLLPLRLPSARRGPAPSPLLVPDVATDPMPPVGLAVWGVPSLFLPAQVASTALRHLRDQGAPADLVPSPSVHCFSWLERLAEAITRRGAYLPTVVFEDGESLARWRTAHLLPDEHAALAALADALPELARANLPLHASDPDAPASPPPSALRLLRGCLDSLVDAQVRARFRASCAAPRGTSPAASLVRALREPYPVLPDDDDARRLADQLAAWTGTAEGDATWQLALRVQSPSDEADPLDPAPDWRVVFELQSRADPSLRLPARAVWDGDPLPGGRRASVEEHLLRSLGLAARVFPPLTDALRGHAPEAHETDSDGVVRFLEEAAPLLQQAGFAVITPPWFGPRKRLSLRGKASSEKVVSGGEVSAGQLLSFRWAVALDGALLSEDELRTLAQSKASLVRLRGKWVHLREGEAAAAVAALQRPPRELSAVELLRLGLGLDPPDSPLPVVGFDADGAIGELLTGSRTPEQAVTPANFVGTLRPYQARGLGWLAFLGSCGLGACLADDMGLGKTIQILALLARERTAGTRPGPTLLLCPLSVVQNWKDEATRFVPDLQVHIHHGSDRPRGAECTAAVEGADLVITTYALLVRDEEELIQGRRWHRVVLDEAQAIKNRSARQSRAARAVQADHRIALTGTPVENRLSELHALMDFLNPGLLGGVAAFRRAFIVPIERDRQPEATERLRQLTRPFLLRRLKTDESIALDLPDKVERKVYCHLTQEQATLYQAAVDELQRTLAGLGQMQRRGAILSALSRLKQTCNHPAQLLGDRSRLAGRSGKLERTEELLDEALAAGDKSLIFTQYAVMGKLLRARLQERFGEEVLLLHGGATKAARDRMVKRFATPEGPRLFVLSLHAGGTGLNLVAANHVIHFDRWWNPAVEQQATDRAYRIGQHRNVQVHTLVCRGTLEERIDAMIERKRGLAELVVGTGEGWLTELSLDELRTVIALSAEAVA